MPDVDLVPTEEMAEAAARGLALRKKHNRGGTAVGVARARDIKNRTELSPETVKRMVAFFDRHEKNKAGGEDDAGYIAWLLWGGDPGRSWANRKVKELERKQENAMTKGKKATMAAAKPKDPMAALKAVVAEAKKAGISPDALDMALLRAQGSSPEGIATLVRDIKAGIANVAEQRKAAAAAAKQAEEQRVAALIPKRGVVGRAIDRARTAVSTLTTKTVDPTSGAYAGTLASAKERGKAAATAYKAAATAHAAALARLDKYVAHAAASIAGAQSAKDVAHFLAAIEAATRTRAVAARSMPTPFARPGAKAKMSKVSQMLDQLESQARDQKDLAKKNANKIADYVAMHGTQGEFDRFMAIVERLGLNAFERRGEL